MTTGSTARTRSGPHRVLAAFLPPATAGDLGAMLPDDEDGLVLAVTLLRARVEADDERLAVALHLDGGAPVSTASRLTGLPPRAVNELLDDVDGLDVPARVAAPAVPPRARAMGRARVAVRVVWLLLLVAALAASVQARGGLLPCREVVCLGDVELVLAGGEVAERDAGGAVAGPLDGGFDPNGVVAVRYQHRSGDQVALTFVWRADGEEQLVQRARLEGSATTAVAWPGGRMPVGVHTVDVLVGEQLVDRTTFHVTLSTGD